MPTQNYANHAKMVPMYHYVLFGVLVLTDIGSVVNFILSLGDNERLYKIGRASCRERVSTIV